MLRPLSSAPPPNRRYILVVSVRRSGSLLDDAVFEQRVREVLSRAQAVFVRQTVPVPSLQRAKRTLDDAIRDVVGEALEGNRRGARWNISVAAVQLGIPRSRLRRLIKRYRLVDGHAHSVNPAS
jgi:DNA-binding NtrC family response regulator